MQFRTEIIPQRFDKKISHKDSIFCIGSCFAQNIQQKLNTHKFNATSSPLGIVYNPISIFENILLNNTYQIIENDAIFYTLQTHSQIFNTSKKALENVINKYKIDILSEIIHTNWLIITFGTSIVYTLKSNNSIVANCHKLPANLFEKRLLQIDEMVSNFNIFYNKIKTINPNINIILTVSPVRHLKETLELNSVSKSLIRVFCNEISEKYSHIYYFPAYEIMQDDLRDYRFYDTDMLHPSPQAIDYIWQKFQDSAFDFDTIKNIETYQSILKDINHRPFHENSMAYLKFLEALKNKLQNYQFIANVDVELAEVVKKIKNIQSNLHP